MSIKELRIEKNLSQSELADKLNVTQGAVSHWEIGRTFPSTEQLMKLAKILDCTIDELLNDIQAKDTA